MSTSNIKVYAGDVCYSRAPDHTSVWGVYVSCIKYFGIVNGIVIELRFRFYYWGSWITIFSKSISVISGRWENDNQKLCSMEPRLRLYRFPPAVIEPLTARSVGQHYRGSKIGKFFDIERKFLVFIER